MNDAMVSLILECLQDLDCKPSYQIQREALEVVVLYELIQVDAK